ncbi:ankyrin repeat domain-containing protein [Aromatoleum evansii]|uniref:Ankyrin repeat domain-containing protein n=1 Tax=Aromatoleum evansii TaxID=59406 RepID=A0ABZ1AF34_AROEV|nr:ankyrin repeat domain-containing protein [Aromatoleum evansii]NMG27712.1 ankyrin repeat domain-containing protein [Aromatoleum evansii]WRL44474.1 ankyrin repeat domain-containing protein [Aromatoleum evansii]
MKHPLFESLGDRYPVHLEEKFDRILTRIEFLWDTPEIHDYFSDLLIDKRGGRQGFPPLVLADIITLREFRELETFRQAERREHAVRELAERGVTVDREAFLAALRAGDRELIDLFVRARFPFHGIDVDGTPPLLFALKRGFTVIASILVNAGADVNARDHLGLTPLLVACGKPTQGYRTIAEALILRGAQVNVRDPLGNTPFLLSLSGGVLDIAELLAERGADIFATTRKGETALALANRLDTPEGTRVAQLIRDKGATR